ncbi:hypothetical protein [Catenulispora rubra]|uniref:hypothetical protein n=1 Tax=Catenulispora rubra TaxID=280293 RepID=UPI0018924D43|nr:hypothetical protein [Catenulispora rubra]
MNRIEWLNARYARSAGLVASGVELITVGDPCGARVDAAVRHVLGLVRDDYPGPWDQLLGAAKSLRWRLITQPQPLEHNTALRQAASDTADEATALRTAVARHVREALEELAAAASSVVEHDPEIATTLVESIRDVGASACVVVAANNAAAAGLESWLAPRGVRVHSVSRLLREPLLAEQAFAVGPPRFFSSPLVTAPVTEAVSYLFPAWFEDHSIPHSALATAAEHAVQVRGRVFPVGNSAVADTALTEHVVSEDELLPQPAWSTPSVPERDPGSDEVAAWRVLLSGGFAILLDDGERIRAVDPSQPGGERVIYVDVQAVRSGTYLLLRMGETERHALYAAALKLLGDQAAATEASQACWKDELQRRLDLEGLDTVTRELADLGVHTLDRIRAWTGPTLARPQNDRDFELLLQWLGIPVQPTYGLATALRRKRAQASANIAEQLEEAVGVADMTALDRDGNLRLQLSTEGFRGVIATRVLAISPHTEIISRHDARVPFEDRGAKWLE